jgi:hypothetical protein
MSERPKLTTTTLRRWLDNAPGHEKSAVIAEASVILGSLEAIYALLDRSRAEGAK